MRRALLAALALAVALAGCGAVPGGLDTSGNDGTDDSIGPERITADLRGQQTAALLSAGSYAYEATHSAPGGTLNLSLNVEGDESWTQVTGAATNRTEFTNATGTYARSVQDGATDYRFRPVVPNNTAFTVATIPYNATYERVGTDEIDGVRVATYEADSAHANATLGSFALGDPARFNATLHVTADGFVKHVAWRTASEAGVSTYDATYTALGATTVEAPPWVGEARSNPPTPEVLFEFERNGTALDVQHAGGDALAAEHTVVIAGNRTARWNTTDGDVVAGDTFTVPAVSEGTTVRVVWTAYDRPAVLGEHTVEG